MSPQDRASKPLDIYIRVSQVRGREGEAFQSPKQQEDRCRKQLDTDSLEAGQVFTDLDQSGGKTSRPAFDKALERARNGESGGLIVHDLTRFGRYESMARDIIELEKAGATFISCAEKIDTTTSTGRFFLTIMSAMSVLQREQIGERINVAQTNAVARGVHVSRFVPAGYMKDENGLLLPHPRHGKTITRAYEIAADGASPSAIARYLNERELDSGNGHTVWKASRIKRLLANPVYKGQARYGEIVNNEAHKPLTDETTWLRAQRKQTARPTVIQDSSEYLLAGFCRCASCRHSMRSQKARGKTIGTYRCVTETASGKCPHPTSISMDRLDDLVYAAWVERTWGRHSEPRPERDDTAALEDLEDAHKALAELQAAESELDPLAYAKAETKILARIEGAEKAVTSAAPLDFDKIVEELGPKVLEDIERVKAGGRVLEGTPPEAIALMRQALARDLQAVFVRPAKSRSNKARIEERVHLIWRGDEMPEVPRRGINFSPAPYAFPDEQKVPNTGPADVNPRCIAVPPDPRISSHHELRRKRPSMPPLRCAFSTFFDIRGNPPASRSFAKPPFLVSGGAGLAW
jgi:DNA invertase Pin-like site-specific DNA recombinase